MVEANASLHPISINAVRWAYEKCTAHIAFCTPKGKGTCMCCGHTFHIDLPAEFTNCPHCGRLLNVEESLKRTYNEKCYFSVLTTHKGFQVYRVALLSARAKKGREVRYNACEIARYWFDDKGNAALTALPRTLGYYCDCFAYGHPIELKNDQETYHYIADCNIYPKYHVLPVFRRNGLRGKLPDVPMVDLLHKLLRDSRVETILKAGDPDALRYFLYTPSRLNENWQQYKITMRNHYHIDDINLWSDLMALLAKSGRDTHNAHYVCPENLRAAHDHYLQLVQKKEMDRQQKEERERALREEADFEKQKGRFFGITFTDGLITISVLDSVKAYLEEGDAMHHCVGQCHYYAKANSLVLSARIDGKRIETVELSLETFKVLQSRGVCNKSTEYHQRIINLVEQNKSTIQRRVNV